MSCKLEIYGTTVRDLICAYVKIDYRAPKPLCHRLALARASILVKLHCLIVYVQVNDTLHALILIGFHFFALLLYCSAESLKSPTNARSCLIYIRKHSQKPFVALQQKRLFLTAIMIGRQPPNADNPTLFDLNAYAARFRLPHGEAVSESHCPLSSLETFALTYKLASLVSEHCVYP